tara:strand:+ start:1228 stop:2004 length:777 start_codon:yes stop_codon:yes gene_type:complete
MAVPAVLSALPTVGRFAMQYLPTIMAVGSAVPALKQGKLGEAAVQGGLGYLTGMPLKGVATGLVAKGMKAAPGLLGGLTDAPKSVIAGGARDVLSTAAGLGALGLGMKQAEITGSPQTARMAGGVAQTGAGVIGYTADGAPVYGGAALPPGMGQYGPTSPYGGPLDVLGPAGMGQRLDTLKTAQTQRDVLRTLLPEIEAAAEARSKKEFERQMAGAGIRQNIQTRAAMQQRAQQAGLQAGLGALQQAGSALTSQYQYQ